MFQPSAKRRCPNYHDWKRCCYCPSPRLPSPSKQCPPGHEQSPPCPLPPALPMSNPVFVWGDYDSAAVMKSLDEAYAEVVHWRRNTFLVPFGNAGKGFVSELRRLFRAYADGSALEAIALKACTVMPILLLQKPFLSSKQKDHTACLARCMPIWKKGDISNLLAEGCSLQSRLPKSHPSGNADDGKLACLLRN